MTSPTDGFDFNSDFNQLQADAKSFMQSEKDAQAAQDDYSKALQSLLGGTNPEFVFMALIMLFSNQGFNELNQSWNANGGALQIQGDITKLNNDLEDASHPQKGDPNYNNPQALHDETLNLDKMLDTLGFTPPAKGSSSDWRQGIYDALGPTGMSGLGQQYGIIRKDIYDPTDGDNEKYGPKEIPASQQTDPWTFHYAVGGSDYFNSFGAAEDAAGQKGDPGQANEAISLWTNAFNANTSTTQSVQAAENQVITNASNTIKTFQSFVADMMHSLSDVVKGSIQHQTGA